MKERWVAIYDGSYELSDHGRVRRLRPAKGATVGAFIAPKPDKDGYLQVGLHLRDGKVTRKIHRMVTVMFIGPPKPHETETNHKDGVKSNNHYKNLEHSDKVRNKIHAWSTGLCNSRMKLTSAQVARVRRMWARGGMLQREIAAKFGVHQTNVSAIVRGKSRVAW